MAPAPVDSLMLLPILTYQLGYTLGNQEPTAISSPPEHSQRLRL